MARRKNRRYGIVVLAMAVGCLLAVYLGASYYVVSASLRPAPPVCPYRTPAESDLTVEEVDVKTADGVVLAAWLIPSSSDRVVVLVHGLASFAWEGAAVDIATAYSRGGFHVLVFDLRAHGGSGGERLGLGWFERQDVRAVVDVLLRRGFAPGKIGLHGTSFGAATSILSAAAIPEVGAVVADSAFADARDVMDREIVKVTGLPTWVVEALGPGLSFVAKWVYGLDLAAITPVEAVSAIAPRPVFFIHGERDEIIPPEHKDRLFDAYGSPAGESWKIEGRGHTEGVRLLDQPCESPSASPKREEYLARIAAFFDRSL